MAKFKTLTRKDLSVYLRHRTNRNIEIGIRHEAGADVVWSTLGHKDWRLAQKQADKSMKDALKGDPVETLEVGDALTLGTLADRYLDSDKFRRIKRATDRQDRETRLRRMVRYFTRSAYVVDLDEEAILQYVEDRRKGRRGLRAASQKSAHNDYSALRTAVKWACQQKAGEGKRLLPFYPFEGIRLDQGKGQRQQPPVEEWMHEAMLEAAAKKQWWNQRMFAVVANGTGRRMNSIRLLRWSQIDFRMGVIRWNADVEKTGDADTSPIIHWLLDDLLAWRHLHPDATFVFEHDGNPYALDTTKKWFDHLWDAAGLGEKPVHLGWHGYRRKFVTERHLEGYARSEIQSFTGHQTMAMIDEYIAAAKTSEIRAKMRSMPRVRYGTSEGVSVDHPVDHKSARNA